MFFSFFLRVSFSLFLIVSFSTYQTFADTLKKEATYYSDIFEGGSTANGEIFSQSNYSAAICGTPLGRLLYVSKGWAWVVIKSNDRPNCSRYPNVIDLSRDAFRLLAPTSVWRIPEVQVTDIGIAPSDVSKWFLPKDIFSHLWVMLSSSVPNILFINQWIEIRGKVTSPSEHVIIYISHEDDPNMKESSLARVNKDGTFSARLLLPGKVGKYTFVIARWKSFNTDEYATITLIDSENLDYPSFPTEKYRFIPRITNIGNISSLSLPENIFGELKLTKGKNIFRAQGTSIIFKNTGLTQGLAQVQIQGYSLSTPSPLDRSARISSLFSWSVILDRKHESINADKVVVTTRNNVANIRFNTPSEIFLRPHYYIIFPSGDVKEYAFLPEQLSSDGYLKQGISVSLRLPLSEDGNYILELVRNDGIAYANILIPRGNIWSIIDPLTDQEIRTVRKNSDTVRQSILLEINTLRKQINKSSVILDPTLSTLAQAKVDDMIVRNYQSHADPEGSYIDGLARKLSLNIEGSIGENIGYGNVSDLALQDWLEESWVHRYNMLQSSWKRVGIGYGIKNDKVYLVHVFGE